MIIRPAIRDDLPRIIEIAQQSAAAAQWSSGEYARMLSSDASLSVRVVLVIGEEGADSVVHGFLAAREVAGEWEIENFAVHESARGRGLGSRLLRAFLELARERHGTEVCLEVRESNAVARALYTKCTFHEAGRRKSYYHNPEEDALILKFSFPRNVKFD